MAGRKRPLARTSVSECSYGDCSAGESTNYSEPKKIKRQVSVSTFKRWQRSFDSEYQTLTWLKCDKENQNRVSVLWCSACREYSSKICSMKNYSRAWVTGSTNQRTSNVLDHVASDQHKAAMSHLRTAQAKASNEPLRSDCAFSVDARGV